MRYVRLSAACLALMLSTAALQAWAAEPPAGATETKVVWGTLTTEDGKTTYPLDKPTMVLGNAPPADVVIADASVAAQHVRFTYLNGVVHIEDLGSRHGTLLNGTALKKGKPMRILTKSSVSPGAVTLNFDFGVRPALIAPTQPLPPKAKGSAKSGKTKPGKAK